VAARKLWLLECGWLSVDNSLIMYRQKFGEKVRIPVMAALVETGDGHVLFDTGLNPDAVEHAIDCLGPKADVVVELEERHDIRNQLQSVGVAPDDVRWVLNSHLHWDHTGGNRFFPNAEFVLQQAEWRFAHSPDPFVDEVYLRQQFDLGRPYRLLSSDEEVCDGVGAIDTPGHTPGHQSLVVKLPTSGTVVVAGDAAYCEENLAESWPPGNPWSMPDAYRSIRRLRFARSFFGATVVIGHDPDLWHRFGPAPYLFD
jgi:N-acyl homoserine lactone hydrolase